MSFVYFKFLFVTTIKRKPVWITWILFLFTCSCFLLILPSVSNMNTLQVWANSVLIICQTLIGMIAALFTAVLAINVFKDTNEEGTELIIISKPISRFKIVLTKFWLFGLFCLLINLTAILLTSFTIFLPKTEVSFYGGLLLSMFIGNLITFGIFGSISILLSVKFVKVGIIVTDVVISLVFLIYQVLTLFVFSTPTNILNNNGMSAATYILLNRNTETGEYKEDEVVKFSPFTVSETLQTKTTCTATNWQEMKDFWEHTIKSKDSSPVLNVTDIASQISLTYMTYKTDQFALRQGRRMFALSRFYNYVLTDPASPEIDDSNKKTLNWLYTDFYNVDLSEILGIEDFDITVPTEFGFAGIEPLTITKLRGYTDKIPVGMVNSKELIPQREVLFEKEQWEKYKLIFDVFFDVIFDYRNYVDLVDTEEYDVEDRPILFAANNNTIKRYYDIVWGCFTHSDQLVSKCKMDPIVYQQYLRKLPANADLEIHTFHNLNDRFIQFKNYVYWKILEIQKNIIKGAVYDGNDEAIQAKHYETLARAAAIRARNEKYDELPFIIKPFLGFHYGPTSASSRSDGWMLCGTSDDGIIGKTKIPSCDLILDACDNEKDLIKEEPEEVQDDLIMNCAKAQLQKSAVLFNNVVIPSEAYLYSSLDEPTRTTKYFGKTYATTDMWLPNMNGNLATALGLNTPLGQNMQYFYYDTIPTIQNWVFAVIWGSISLGLFATGVVLYNKYDVK